MSRRPDEPRVVAYVPDLMDRSRVSAAAPATRFVATPDELAGVEADVVVVDLSRAGVLEVLPRVTVRTIGFVAHVDHDAMEAARVAGCGQVLARSEFFRRSRDLLSS